MVSTKVMRQYWCFFVIFISYFYSIHITCLQEAYTNTYKNNKCTKQRNDCVHISSLLLRLLIIFTFFHAFSFVLLFLFSFSYISLSSVLSLSLFMSKYKNRGTAAGSSPRPFSDWIQLFTNKGTVNVFHNCKYESKDESNQMKKTKK